jgi:hypothetical protein
MKLTLYVALLWAVWHLPDHFAEEGWGVEALISAPIIFAIEFVSLFFARALFVWFYNVTAFSVLSGGHALNRRVGFLWSLHGRAPQRQKELGGTRLLYRPASQRWAWISANCRRLRLAATFPDHLIDLNKAIARVRGHGPGYGADPVIFAAGSRHVAFCRARRTHP